MRRVKVSTLILAAFIFVPHISLVQSALAQRVWNSGYYDDSAPQFNEQGYNAASSFTNAGVASINNFNGNLVYRKSLYSFEGEGGFDMNIALSYNGSTPHSIVGLIVDYFGQLRSPLSINTPEWILSVNGIGIQVFNFENNLHAWAQGSNCSATAKYDTVPLLVDGYHLNIQQAKANTRSTLRLLLDDGTSELIVDTEYVTQGGLGLADGKTSFTKFWSAIDFWGTMKRFWVKRGDGTTIFGRGYHPKWKSGYQEPCGSGYYALNTDDTLGLFLPDSIYNVDGHVITFEYLYQYGQPTKPIYGHPLLSRITLNHDTARSVALVYSMSQDTIKSVSIGDYTLYLSGRPGTDVCPTLDGEANRAYVWAIKDPEERYTYFDYGRYVRGITDFCFTAGKDVAVPGWCYYNWISAQNVYPDVFRIAEIREHTGGVTRFGYYNQGVTDSLEQLYSESIWFKKSPNLRYPPYWNATGRDAFFSNMVVSSTRWNRNATCGIEQLVSSDSLVYTWNRHGDLNAYDQTDTITTTKYSDSTACPAPNGEQTTYTYIMYPYARYYSSAGTEQYWAPEWFTALVRVANHYDTISTEYDVGTCNGKPPDYPGCDGTFRPVRTTAKISGRSYSTHYANGRASDGFNFATDTTKLPSGRMVIRLRDETYLAVADSTSLYFNGNPVRERQYDAQGELLTDRRIDYYNAPGSDGNYAQLHRVVDYTVLDGTTVDSTSVILSYHRNETEGIGNLKKVITPNGDSVRLWYNLPDTSISGYTYSLSSQIVDKDGDVTLGREFLPKYRAGVSRLEFYPPGRILRLRRAYDRYGDVTRFVDYNNVLSLYDYDAIRRVQLIGLPMSFDSTITQNGRVTRDDIYGFDSRYSYTDTMAGLDYVSAAATRRQDFHTSLVTADTTYTTDERTLFASVSFTGYDADSVRLQTCQRLRYNLLMTPFCDEASYARIKRNGELVATITCGQPDVHDSIQASAGDEILVEINDSHSHGGSPQAECSYIALASPIVTLDTVHTLDRHTRMFFDGFWRNARTDFISPYHLYDSVTVRHDFRNKVQEARDQLTYRTSTAYDRIGRPVRVVYPDSASSQDSVRYEAVWLNEVPAVVRAHTTMSDSFLVCVADFNENRDSVVTYFDAEQKKRFVRTHLDGDTLWNIFDYDELGNLSKVVSPNGNSVNYRYNSLGELTKEWSSDYDTIYYRYDKNGNLVLKRDGAQTARGQGTVGYWTYVRYDPLDRVTEQGEVKVTGPDTTLRTPMRRHFYDQDGSAFSMKRLSASYSQTPDFRYGEKFDYDPRGRISTHTVHFNADLDSATVNGRFQYTPTGDSLKISYTYNNADQLTSIVYPSGAVITYEYDYQGRLTSVGDTVDHTRYARLTYTQRDELDSLILQGGLQIVNYAYNARGWLNVINGGDTLNSDKFGERLYYYGGTHLPSLTYRNGNIQGQDIAFPGESRKRFKYAYDDMDRLAARYRKGNGSLWYPDESFEYDANGNQTLSLRMAGVGNPAIDSVVYQYIAGTNLLGTVSGTSNGGFTFDQRGNLTADGRRGNSFGYDPFNQLNVAFIAASGVPDDVLRFGYNVNGERTWKSFLYHFYGECLPPPDPDDTTYPHIISPPPGDSGWGEGEGMMQSSGAGGGGELCLRTAVNTTYYLVSQGKVLAEYSSLANPPDFTYIYAGDQRIAFRDKLGKLYFYLSDHLGSARIVVDTTGIVKDKYRYLSFGRDDGHSVSTNQPRTFTGQTWDAEGSFDLFYYGRRYYDPSLGRFTQVDPSQANYPGWSPFLYALDNPPKYTDPNGTDIWFAVEKDAAFWQGHTNLYFQKKDRASVYKYSQGRAQGSVERNSGSLGSLDALLLLVPGTTAEAKVTIEEVQEDQIPKDAVRIETTPEQDEMIAANAMMSLILHNSGVLLYSAKENNCTDASVDVVNGANVGIQIPNPQDVQRPNSWFKVIKKWMDEQQKQKESEERQDKKSDEPPTPDPVPGSQKNRSGNPRNQMVPLLGDM